MDRKQHWEKVYADKSSLKVSWYQAEPTLSLELISNTRIAKDASIIDVGGGSSVLVDYLLQNGYQNISVLDLSTKALNHAQQRLAKLAAQVNWITADITEFTPPQSYDLWHDRAVFHFLTSEQDQKQYVEVLKNSTKPGAHIIIASFAIGGPDKCSGLDIVQYDADKLCAVLGAEFSLVEEHSERHITPAKQEQKFNYYRFQRK